MRKYQVCLNQEVVALRVAYIEVLADTLEDAKAQALDSVTSLDWMHVDTDDTLHPVRVEEVIEMD